MKKAVKYFLGLGIISATAVTIWKSAKADEVESIGIDDLDDIDEMDELDEDGEDGDEEEDEITIELFEMEPEAESEEKAEEK